MIDKFKNLFGLQKTDFAQLLKQGAIIIDVRSRDEYATGHIDGSINIPVNKLDANLDKLNNKQNPIITCCASGNRSVTAKNILELKGYTKVYNGGGWQSLKQNINLSNPKE